MERKMENLSKLEVTDFLQLIHDIGFLYLSESGSVAMIPPGILTVTLNLDEKKLVHGLRWQLFGTPHMVTETRKFLHEMLETSEEAAKRTVGVLKHYLDHLH